MKAYDWTCLACQAVNASNLVVCARCSCSASPTSAQVSTARDMYRRRAGLPMLEPVDPLALVRGLPLLPIGAVVLLLIGGLALIVSENGATTAFGGLMLSSAALCASSWRRPPNV